METFFEDRSTYHPDKDPVSTCTLTVECAPGQVESILSFMRLAMNCAGVYSASVESGAKKAKEIDMPNSRWNQQVGQIKETKSEYKDPKRGTAAVPTLNMSVPKFAGLPGKSGPDRGAGFGELEKVYAQAKGIAGGTETKDD